MKYLLHVSIDERKRTYRIDANDEVQAKERMLLRLPPHQRDEVVINGIERDPAFIGKEEPFGIFLNDNHD